MLRTFKTFLISNYAGEQLRLLVSIGGAGRSQNFPSLVADDESRRRFVEEVLELW